MWSRVCPSCGEEKQYKNRVYFNRVVAVNGVCHACAKKRGKTHNRTSSDCELKVVELLASGLNDRDVSRQLSLSKSTVSGIRRRYGLPARGRHLFELQIGSDGKAACASCGERRDEKDFMARPTTYHGLRRSPMCKFCEYKNTNTRLSSLEAYMKHKASTLKSSAKKQSLPFDLTWEYLIALFKTQNGGCFYTDEALKYERGNGHSKQSLSVDKIVPEKGYTRENVVLCTYKANVVKNSLSLEEIQKWIPSWFDRIETRRRSKCWLAI